MKVLYLKVVHMCKLHLNLHILLYTEQCLEYTRKKNTQYMYTVKKSTP